MLRNDRSYRRFHRPPSLTAVLNTPHMTGVILCMLRMGQSPVWLYERMEEALSSMFFYRL